MAKLTIFALLALFALAHVATAFRTIVTVIEEEEDFNPARPQQRCQEQIQRQQQLRHCQMHLKEKSRRQSSVLEMSTDNNDDDQEQYLDQCCQQLRNIDEQCRCKGLQEAVRQQQQQQTRGGERGQTEQRQKQRIIEEAERLPSRCDVSPRSCTFERSPRWF
ncbi:2S seed storage albumin protein-like [Impatiens glandulifera]|uniref:2S seed storage albumin protein-like n=1 Tax=Impatiens glandulifera TaxID=253017 RepID=UPI001FB0A514|nr:2S seed storage albumin protein-like [Impatiens glandulifera]